MRVKEVDSQEPESAICNDEFTNEEMQDDENLPDDKDDQSDSEEEEAKDGERPGFHGGRWSKEEHERFLMAMRIYGKDWDSIETFVGTRDATHCRSHAQKFFTKLLKYSQKSSE